MQVKTECDRCIASLKSLVAQRTYVFFLLALLGACAQQPLTTPAGSVARKPAMAPVPESACQVVLDDWQVVRRQADIIDAQVRSVGPGKVFAVNRLMASFYPELDSMHDSVAARRYWLTQSWEMAYVQRQIEYANLPGSQLNGEVSVDQVAIEACATRALQEATLLAAKAPLALGDVTVPDDYRSWARVLGVYPLSREIVLPRIRIEQDRARHEFQQQPPGDSTRWYQPLPQTPSLSVAAVSQHLRRARESNPLGVPQLDAPTLQAFIAHFAPAWAIETHSRNDQPGVPYWQTQREIAVDITQPSLYYLPSYTRFQGQVLLQLNYFIWFPERPKAQWYDLYGGDLDGLVWRVTLLPDGQVLAYDSIHQCGCYHQFFAVDGRLRARSLAADQEPVLLFSNAIPDALQTRVVVQLSDIDHAIVGLRAMPAQSATGNQPPLTNLIMRDYNELRRLPQGEQQQSLFASNGLIPQSRRLERWLLWPMGVASAGAMRQWGRHATAFIGRRHFDDPWLLDKLLDKLLEVNDRDEAK